MNQYLLADALWLAGLAGVGFAIVVILVEALVLYLFRLNPFRKCVVDSLMANIGSFLLAILLFLIFNKEEFEGVSQITELFILYFISSIFEAWIVKLLNTRIGWGRILVASLVMNLVFLGVLYLYAMGYIGL